MLVDPLSTTALHSLDLGSVYSADGREHPITAMTPAYDLQIPGSLSPSKPVVSDDGTSSPVSPGGTVVQADFFPGWVTSNLPTHFSARLAVGIVAIGLLLIVAFRLTK